MQIQCLFDDYRKQVDGTENVDEIFDEAGMVNEYGILDFGFFPIGSGILNENSHIQIAGIDFCDVMVLGNDFGTVDYVKNNCPNNKEKASNPTIKNLMRLGLNPSTTFFTNLFLGLRKNGKNIGPKNVTEQYKNFCIEFFRTQLKSAKPKIVLCLGTKVGESLFDFSTELKSFSRPKISDLFIDKNDFIINFENFKFVLIPHPSFAHINWKNIEGRIKSAIVI